MAFSLNAPNFASVHSLSYILLPLFISISFIAFVLLSTTLVTTYHYHLGLSRAGDDSRTKPFQPPRIPYTVPLLGNALSFRVPKPGIVWENLFQKYPRSIGALTLLLGGRPTHIIFSSTAIQALFKNRTLGRHSANQKVLELGLGIEHNEAEIYYGRAGILDKDARDTQERLLIDFILPTNRVNELTAKFSDSFRVQLKNEEPNYPVTQDLRLFEFLRLRMFRAATTALMGDELLRVYPQFPQDFFKYEPRFLTLLFGTPKYFAPEAYKIRDKITTRLENYHAIMNEKLQGKIVDSDGDVSWEPDFGSRFNRMRQKFYTSRALKLRTKGALDLGFVFASASNAIPATGWILMHLLDPNGDKTVLERVIMEVESVKDEDGSLNIPALLSLPLLQSVLQEVLRLYVDIIISRELEDDIILPIDEDGKRKVLLKKNGLIMAPTWTGHRHDDNWAEAPSSSFYAERFLKLDPGTGKVSFTTKHLGGKFFPWGGGKVICPGRVFAKQEVKIFQEDLVL